jgi:hypothetical protein
MRAPNVRILLYKKDVLKNRTVALPGQDRRQVFMCNVLIIIGKKNLISVAQTLLFVRTA